MSTHVGDDDALALVRDRYSEPVAIPSQVEDNPAVADDAGLRVSLLDVMRRPPLSRFHFGQPRKRILLRIGVSFIEGAESRFPQHSHTPARAIGVPGWELSYTSHVGKYSSGVVAPAQSLRVGDPRGVLTGDLTVRPAESVKYEELQGFSSGMAPFLRPEHYRY